jgi:hypothetical protein
MDLQIGIAKFYKFDSEADVNYVFRFTCGNMVLRTSWKHLLSYEHHMYVEAMLSSSKYIFICCLDMNVPARSDSEANS